jgi:long-chain acyl-CoA synthetase
MSESVYKKAMARAPQGMEIAAVAAEYPERIAIYSQQGDQSFAELNAQANRIVRALRDNGVAKGAAVALCCNNRLEFAAVRFALHRGGYRITPVNWHLSADEIAYIVQNCEAQALFAGDVAREQALEAAARCGEQLKLKVAIGDNIDGFVPFADALQGLDGSDIDDPELGAMMLYTSGTTGRPKGVKRAPIDPNIAAQMLDIMMQVFQYDPECGTDLALCTGPLYHAGPFNICLSQPLSAGIGTVMMDKWDAEETLQLIERYKISHSFFVPTMFNRLLQLPQEVRSKYDVSTLKFVIHGAAPCAVDVKQKMMDWFGPIIWELFAGTEGQGTMVSPQEWLAKPGTVGKPAEGKMRILDDDGKEVARGEIGTVYIHSPPENTFEYHGDKDKTASVMREDYFTAGDVGYIDEDGYLFLTGRSVEVIISGGVNIYPQEIDDLLAQHEAIKDVACVGVPNADWGEEVKAVISLRDGFTANDETEAAIRAFAEEKLAKQKWPRSYDFVADLPRSEAGKVQRKQIRAQYWPKDGKQI